MTLVSPERTVKFTGSDYGLLVLDPTDDSTIFNARYPIFGSDITNAKPQIISHRITVTNSSGAMNEPVTSSIPWVSDGEWYGLQYNQMNNQLIGSVPHGQGRIPQFMVTGYAFIRQTMRMRYWHRDQDGSMTYDELHSADNGFVQNDIPPSLGGVYSIVPYPANTTSFQFSNVGPYSDPISNDNLYNSSPLTITADETNIYIRASLVQNLYYQRIRDSYGWDRYEKYWSDLSGSWYQFTFYILPYDRGEDIYIR